MAEPTQTVEFVYVEKEEGIKLYTNQTHVGVPGDVARAKKSYSAPADKP